MCLLEPLSRSVVLSKFYQFYVTYHLQHQCSIKSWRVQFELNGPGKYSSVSHSIKTHLLNTVCVLLAPVKTALTHQDTDTCADKTSTLAAKPLGTMRYIVWLLQWQQQCLGVWYIHVNIRTAAIIF